MVRRTPPNSDDGTLAFAKNVDAKLAAAAADYGQDAAFANRYHAKTQAFADLLTIARDPVQRTHPKVLAKQQARRELDQITRVLIRSVKSKPEISDEKRAELGIEPDKQREPIQPMTTSPVTIVDYVNGRTVGLSFQGTEEEASKRPYGAEAVLIFSYIGEDPVPEDLSKWQNHGSTTTLKAIVTFPVSVPAFSRIAFAAAWQTNRRAVGPACDPIFTNLGSGLSNQAA